MSYFSESTARRGIGSIYETLILDSASRYGVDPALIKAIIAAESAWVPAAVSFNGTSVGLMQINYQAHKVSIETALVPEWNVSYGTALIGNLLATRPSVDLALAAYNAGTGRSNADLQDRITRNVNGVGNYVTTVLQFYEWYLTNDPAASLGGASVSPPFRDRPIPAHTARRERGRVADQPPRVGDG